MGADCKTMIVYGGTSYDTIAIVLSVLVGAVGYMVQAWSTVLGGSERGRAGGGTAALGVDTAAVSPLEHGQMIAHIERTKRWLDQCCWSVLHGLEVGHTLGEKVVHPRRGV